MTAGGGTVAGEVVGEDLVRPGFADVQGALIAASFGARVVVAAAGSVGDDRLD